MRPTTPRTPLSTDVSAYNWELIIDGRDTEILEGLTFEAAQLVGAQLGPPPVGYTLRQLRRFSAVAPPPPPGE